jgi:membrane peptidoglycan carboxypeptidase
MLLDAELPTVPLANAVQVFGGSLPERDRVKVAGTMAVALSARLPGGPWHLQPRIEGFAVDGLGTERLLDLQRPAACRVGSDADIASVTGWLPRAVIAAEDQRFFEHSGYDLAALTDAWQQNQQPGAALTGASTITQQLAKLVVTGDERSATRKLRELLYAVEIERTLGKARILQLYLALAPWGEGVCGAERAVRVHLGQRDASTIGPVAAAWLASLLPAPDALLHAEHDRGEIDQERVARVIEGLRPMQPERRDKARAQLTSWSPPALARPREALPASHEPPAPAPLESPTIVSPGAAATHP